MAPNSFATSIDASLLQLSTTIVSILGYVCSLMDSRQNVSVDAELKVGIVIDISGFVIHSPAADHIEIRLNSSSDLVDE